MYFLVCPAGQGVNSESVCASCEENSYNSGSKSTCSNCQGTALVNDEKTMCCECNICVD